MSDTDDKKKPKPMSIEIEPFGPEDDQEVRALQGKAEYVLKHGTDYGHLKGQLDYLHEAGEPIMLVDPRTAQYLCMSWSQLSEMVHHLARLTRREHELLAQIEHTRKQHEREMEEEAERYTRKILQCEAEAGTLRRWKERVTVDFSIPDTYE